jgi:hemolysin activation/secretion protein
MKMIIKSLTLSTLVSTSLLAVDVPNMGNISKEINPPKNINKNDKGLIEIDGIKKVTPSMVDDKSGKKVLVKEFKIEGNTKISIDEINKVIKEYVNKELNFSQMQEVATIITKLYRDKGYFVARAYVPMQNMQNNILTIVIIEGKFGQFNINNNSKVKNSVVQSIFDESKKQEVISSNSIERSMLIANDLSGLYISKADVKAGSEIGSSDFDIEVSPQTDYNGYVIADNYGSRYTGKNRMMGGLTVNSPFKIGDKLSFVGLLSDNTDLKYLDGSYETLLHPNGLKGGFGYSYTGYELGKEYKNLDAKGNQKDLNVNISYPIIKQRDVQLDLKSDFDNKKIKDEINSTNTNIEKEINVGKLSLDYKSSSIIYSLPSTTSLNVSLSYGNLKFKNNIDVANDKAGADTNGDYKKFNIEAFKSLEITSKFTLETKLKYQHSLSNKNLDGSEDLSIGGIQGVKVYPTSEVSAENGYIATVEAKYQLPNINNYLHTIGAFYDRARAYIANSENVESEDRDIQDIGLSYYVTYKDFFLNSYMAWRVNSDSITSEPDYNSKFLVQAGLVF